jgi:hypothetical protein
LSVGLAANRRPSGHVPRADTTAPPGSRNREPPHC